MPEEIRPGNRSFRRPSFVGLRVLRHFADERLERHRRRSSLRLILRTGFP